MSEDAAEAIRALSSDGSFEQRGAVYTKEPVVEAILDLSGYVEEEQLFRKRFLEPSFGNGDFLIPAIRRLLRSTKLHNIGTEEIEEVLKGCIVGVELHNATYLKTKEKVQKTLLEFGVGGKQANSLSERWLINGDFLTSDIEGRFQFVVGNPPYVRQERIPKTLLQLYRDRYSTLYDRADLYILFFERGLDLLHSKGSLSFICANRWMKNKFGGPLREKIANGFNLKYFIDLEEADAFHSEVIAYPAITVIEKCKEGKTVVSVKSRSDVSKLARVMSTIRKKSQKLSEDICVISGVTNGRDPWLIDAPLILETLRKLEGQFVTLEESQIKVGIGVASGCDRVYIGPYETLDVEKQRKLPLVMAGDLKKGKLKWAGKGIVNPYTESGELAELEKFPKFARYLLEHRAILEQRHTARKQPAKWYKTIDRIYPRLTRQPKLLIPDIKGENTVVYDSGDYYPHHNLYVVTSDCWNLKAVQAILRSSIALMFVAAYCVKMSGGFLRFQAQYLRRIRVPRWGDLSKRERLQLIEVSDNQNLELVDSAVFPLFGLNAEEAKLISAFAKQTRVRKNNG